MHAIADVLELIDLSMGRLQQKSDALWAQSAAHAAEKTALLKTEPTVLIVIDSVPCELLSMTFKNAGYRVERLGDGQKLGKNSATFPPTNRLL